MNLACPSCGFMTVEEETYGTFEICYICNWQDDQVQLANPCTNGGANSKSLLESQLQALAKWPLEINELNGIIRSRKWRPLNKEEIQQYKSQEREKSWTNRGLLYESETYWGI